MSKLTKWMDRRFYGEYVDRWDDAMLGERIRQELQPTTRALDLGAGRGHRNELAFKGRCEFIAGVDPDEVVLQNPNLDEAKVQSPPDYAIPYPDDSFDLVFSNSVIEHITDGESFFAEIYRVLKPGGLFIGKTPNRRHYVPMLARVTPHWFHDFYNRLRGRASEDTFPTTYVCNTVGSLRSVCAKVGFEVESLETVEGRPEYLRLSFPTYLVGMAYERMVNSAKCFEGIRFVMFLHARKPIHSA